jgi:hypothetical protein
VGFLFLTHAAGSAVTFLLAHNFFLAMLFYLTAGFTSSPNFQLRFQILVDRLQKK